MRHALLQAVWIEMCVGSVCAQPNDKNPPSVFFLILLNNFPFLKSSRSQMPVCVTSHRQAPPTIVWLTVAFQQTGLVSYLRPALSELSSVCHCFTAGADVDKNDSD